MFGDQADDALVWARRTIKTIQTYYARSALIDGKYALARNGQEAREKGLYSYFDELADDNMHVYAQRGEVSIISRNSLHPTGASFPFADLLNNDSKGCDTIRSVFSKRADHALAWVRRFIKESQKGQSQVKPSGRARLQNSRSSGSRKSVRA